jgi:quinol monooxygenase YgiN
MFVVTVEFEIRREWLRQFREAMLTQASDSLTRESSCQQFDVCYAPDDESRILLYEVYDDADAFAQHLESEHFRQFDATVKPWTQEKVVRTWERQPVDR